MRELFVSEKRYIRNLLLRQRKVDFDDFEPVVIERYRAPRIPSASRFNTDFVLQFVNELTNFESCCARVLPNTLGAEIFLTFDRNTSRPLRTELLAGEAFPIKFFKEHVITIEDTLAILSRPINLRRTAYCRIFVIENDICFLAFPKDPVPVVRGQRQLLRTDEDSTIACSVEGDDIVYVDGWIRTFVQDSVRKLEAIAQ